MPPSGVRRPLPGSVRVQRCNHGAQNTILSFMTGQLRNDHIGKCYTKRFLYCMAVIEASTTAAGNLHAFIEVEASTEFFLR